MGLTEIAFRDGMTEVQIPHDSVLLVGMCMFGIPIDMHIAH